MVVIARKAQRAGGCRVGVTRVVARGGKARLRIEQPHEPVFRGHRQARHEIEWVGQPDDALIREIADHLVAANPVRKDKAGRRAVEAVVLDYLPARAYADIGHHGQAEVEVVHEIDEAAVFGLEPAGPFRHRSARHAAHLVGGYVRLHFEAQPIADGPASRRQSCALA